MEPRFLYLKDGRVFPVPDNWPDDFVQTLKQEFRDFLLPDPTFGGAVAEGLINIPRGFLQTGLGAAQGITALLPGDTGAEDLIRRARQGIAGTMDPRYTDSTVAQLGSGLGSLGAFVGASMAGGPLAGAALGAVSGTGEQAERLAQMEDRGEDVNLFQRGTALLGGTALGLTEAIPAARIAGLAPKAVQAGAARALAAAGKKVPRGAISQAIGSATITGLEEGLQELGAAAGQNIVSRVIYDPTQQIAPSMQEGVVGFGSGAIYDLLMTGLAGRYGGRRMASQRADEEARRRARIGQIAQDVQKVQDDAQAAQSEQNRDLDPATDYPTEFSLQQNPQDGTWAIIDDATGQPVQAGLDEDQATDLRAQIIDQNARLGAVAGALARLKYQGLDTSPEAVEAAVYASMPENNGVPIPSVAAYIAEQEGVDAIDPRSRMARESLRRGLTPDERTQTEAERAELQERLQARIAREQAAQEPEKPFRAKPVPMGRFVTGERGETTGIETEYGTYRLVKQGRGKWDLFFPNRNAEGELEDGYAPFRYGRYRTREEARKAVREAERPWTAAEAAETRARQEANQQRRVRRAELARLEAETELDEFESALAERGVDLDSDMQAVFDELRTLYESGRSYMTLAEMQNFLVSRLGPKGHLVYQKILTERAGLSALALTQLNRDAVNERTRTGLPRLRTKKEGQALLEQAREQFLQQTGRRELPEGLVTTAHLEELTRDKGWRKNTLVQWARGIVGRDIDNLGDLNQAERLYLYTQIAALPTLTGEGYTPLPDMSDIRYTPEQYAAVRNTLAGMESVRPNRMRQILREQADVDGPVLDQILGHMENRGLVTKQKDGSYQYAEVPTTEQGTTQPEAAMNAVLKALNPEGGPVTPEVQQTAQRLQAALDARAEAVRQAAAEAGQQEAAEQAIKEEQDFVLEMAERNQKAESLLIKWVEKQLGVKLTADKKERLKLKVTDDMQKVTQNLARAVVGAEVAGAYVDMSTGGPGQIFLNAAAVDPENRMSAEQLAEALRPTLTYEVMRFMRDADLFTESEWRALEGLARRTQMPNGTMTYMADAGARVGDLRRPGAREEVRESAIAEMVRDVSTGDLTVKQVVPKGLFARTRRFMEDMLGIAKDAEILPGLTVLSDIAKGVVGGRRPGMSPIDPEGPIRSLLDTAREIGPTPTPGATAPSEFPKGWKPDESWVGPDTETPGGLWGRTGPPLEASRPLSEEEAAALTARRDAETEADLSRGRVPAVGKNASPTALNVYYGPQLTGDGRLSPAVRFRLRRDNETEIPYAKRLTNYDQPNKDPFTSFLDAIQSYGIVKAMDRNGPDLVRHLRSQMRAKILDGRKEMGDIDDMMRELMSERDPYGETLLAEQEAANAVYWSDQMIHFLTQAFNYGKLRYARNVDMDNGAVSNVERSDDVTFGFWVVEEAPLITKDGKEFNNFHEVMALLHRPDGTNGEREADEYISRRRIIDLIERGERADAEMQSGGVEPDRLRELQRRSRVGKKFATLMPKADAMADVAMTESDPSKQWIVDFTEGYRAWNNHLLDMLLDTGVIDEYTHSEWTDAVYVPFKKGHIRDLYTPRVINKKINKRTSAARRATIEQELEGSLADIDIPLMERILDNTERITHDAMLNVAHARTAKFLVELGLGVEKSRDQLKSTENAVKYYEGGQEKWVQIVDGWTEGPHLIAALNAGGEDLIEGAWKALPIMSNVLRQSVTRMPDFMIRNMARDTFSVFVTSGAGFTPVIDTLANFVPGERGDASFKVAQQAGLSLETDNVNDVRRWRKHITKTRKEYGQQGTPHLLAKVWDALGEVSKRSDTATRMAVFDRVYRETGSFAEAQKQALEVINFGRRGRSPIWRLITTAVPFLNARVQGLDILYRSFAGKYTANRFDEAGRMRAAQEIRNSFISRGLLLTAITGAYYALVGDEDWYEDQRDEVKDDYWLIPGPAQTLVKIPVPFEVGLLFKTIPEQIARNVFEQGYTTKEHLNSLRRAVFQATNFNPTPQVVKPLAEALVNYNSFTGTRIVPEYMEEGLPPLERRNITTSETAVMLASMLNTGGILKVDPLRVEYLVNGYFASIGGYLLSLADVFTRQEPVRKFFNALPIVEDLPQVTTPDMVGSRADMAMWRRNTPFLRSVIGDREQGGGYQQRFYEMRQQVEQIVAGLNKARRDGRIDDYRANYQKYRAALQTRNTVRQLDRYMARWRERRDAILRSRTMSPEDKREAIRLLEQERNDNLGIVPYLVDISRGRETVGRR